MNILCNISLIEGVASEFASDSKNNCTKNSPSIPYGRLCVYMCVLVPQHKENVLETHRISINGSVWRTCLNSMFKTSSGST